MVVVVTRTLAGGGSEAAAAAAAAAAASFAASADAAAFAATAAAAAAVRRVSIACEVRHCDTFATAAATYNMVPSDILDSSAVKAAAAVAAATVVEGVAPSPLRNRPPNRGGGHLDNIRCWPAPRGYFAYRLPVYGGERRDVSAKRNKSMPGK